MASVEAPPRAAPFGNNPERCSGQGTDAASRDRPYGLTTSSHAHASAPAAATDSVTIGLLGDVMLGRGVGAELRIRRVAQLWDEPLRALTRSLDLLVCNLECCVSLRGAPTSLIAGKPFFFRAPPEAVDALRAIGARGVTLANNHALDFGEAALADTVSSLTAAGIATAGAGRGEQPARRAAILSAGPRPVALVAATDHPAEYAATPATWGVAYADLRHGVPDWLLDEIAAARHAGQLVIASPHWGPNMTTRPAPWQRRAATAMQRAGASLVAGHSAHVFHGVEWTADGPILYDLGDALDDYRVDEELRNDLGTLAIWRPGDAGAELELVGLRLEYAHTGLAQGPDADWIARRLERACRELGTTVERIGEQRFQVSGG